MKFIVSPCLLIIFATVCFAEKDTEISPVLAKPGELIIDDSFDRAQLGELWAQIRGEWKIADGEVVGKELKADNHAAVLHCLKKNRDSIVRFSFKLNGAEGFHFSLNHKAGHLFRVLVSPTELIVRTDGDKKDKSIKSEMIAKAKGTFEQNKWYTMQIEMVGDKVAVTTDNGLKVSGQSTRIDTEKPNYRFILKGEYLVLDDLKVWSTK